MLTGGDFIKKPRAITNGEAQRLNSRLSGRDRILLQLAVESGLRISDILKIKAGDIKKPMTIYETKSRRKRTFEISDKLFRDLKFLSGGLPDSSFVFYSARDSTKHIHRSTIHRRIKKALRGLDFDASAHSTRKLYAQNVLKETGSVTEVQKAMNHQKLLTTLTYLDVDVTKLIGSGVASETKPNATERQLQNAQKNPVAAFKRLIKNLFGAPKERRNKNASPDIRRNT